jgi:hypothetical protein
VSNTEFEGGDDGHGYGDCIFLVKQAQPSHILSVGVFGQKKKMAKKVPIVN